MERLNVTWVEFIKKIKISILNGDLSYYQAKWLERIIVIKPRL